MGGVVFGIGGGGNPPTLAQIVAALPSLAQIVAALPAGVSSMRQAPQLVHIQTNGGLIPPAPPYNATILQVGPKAYILPGSFNTTADVTIGAAQYFAAWRLTSTTTIQLYFDTPYPPGDYTGDYYCYVIDPV